MFESCSIPASSSRPLFLLSMLRVPWCTIQPTDGEKVNMKRLSQYLLFLPLVIATHWFSVRAESPNASAVVRLDPSLDQIFPADAKLELLEGEGSFEGGE